MKRFWLHRLRHGSDEEALDLGTSKQLLPREGYRGRPKTVPEKGRCPEQFSSMPRQSRGQVAAYLFPWERFAVLLVILANVDLILCMRILYSPAMHQG